jgi:hypothetical protein
MGIPFGLTSPVYGLYRLPRLGGGVLVNNFIAEQP